MYKNSKVIIQELNANIYIGEAESIHYISTY